MAKRKAVRAAGSEAAVGVSTKAGARGGWPEWWPAAAVALLAFVIYANGIGNGFVGDDKFQLVKNPLVSGPIDLGKLFGSSVWGFLGLKGNYYRPLQFLAYCLIYQVAGLSAPAFHFVMVAFAALNAALVYFLVRRLVDGRVAMAAAALFAIHPVHTETVDWIAALPDLMMTTFVLTGVLLFARQEGAPRGVQIAGHCGLYLAALWTKETGAALIVLYAAYGWIFLARGWGEMRRNIALYSAMAATFGVYLAMRAIALGGLAPAQQAFIHLTAGDFALNVVVMAGRYIGMLLLPIGLNYFHVFHAIHGVILGLVASVVAIGAIAAAFWRAPKAFVAYGILWVAVTIAPALNLTGVGENVFTERYLYLPSVGFCWIAGWAWWLLAEQRMKAAQIVAAALALACVVATVARNRDWQDTFTMLQVTVKASPDAGLMHDALAAEYIDRENVNAALAEERLAVQYEPQMAMLHKKLGYILMGLNPREAAQELGKAAEMEPSVAANHYDVGTALEAAGDTARAAVAYRQALQLDPGMSRAKEALARVNGGPH